LNLSSLGSPGGVLTFVAMLVLLAAGCATDRHTSSTTSGAEQGSTGPTVVVTTTVWGDVASNIVGENGVVEVLMPLGADPHGFQASSQQVAALHAADLVVANGLGLEGGLLEVLAVAQGDGANILEVAPLLDPIPFGSGDADHEEPRDPHVWMDPTRAADGARIIGRELAAIAPNVDWVGRADTYAATLLSTDDAIEDTLAPIAQEQRRMVTNHDALGYFADRYDLAIIGTVVPGGSSLADPSSAELADLVETMRREDVNVIFAETTQPAALAEAVASELGEEVRVVELYTGSLGEPGSGADTLAGMLVTNARRIADALGGVRS
jgi:zinc/manganese transport system substrate-binding protein